MSDQPSNFEFDQMLSAYIDGELSEGERAAVEARLATDPAAQQLLHELRSVSQSVQALPTESLPRDLSEEIIRRARNANPELAMHESLAVRGPRDPAPTPDRRSPADTLPKIRIFHSRRAWIWASLALAAGLMLMIVQSGDESANKLPPIAARNHKAAPMPSGDEAGERRRREISISAAPNSPSQSPPTIASGSELRDKIDSLGTTPATKSSGVVGGGRSSITRDDRAAFPPVAAASPSPKSQIKEEEKFAANAGHESSTSTASSGPAAIDKLAPAAQPTGSLGGTVGVDDTAAEKQRLESIAGSNPQSLVLVRVVAKPDALKNGAFERLLANNKIEFEAQAAKNQSRSFDAFLANRAQSKTASEEPSNKDSEIHADNTEVVLVEAPTPAIEACLAELNKNSNDFLSVSISERPQSHDRFDNNSTATKKLPETTKDLSRFSRGSGAIPQKDIDLRFYFYSYDFDKRSDFSGNGSPRAGDFAPKSDALTAGRPETAAKASDYKKQSSPNMRRARHIETWAIDKPQSGEPASAGGRADHSGSASATTNQPMSQRNPVGSAEVKADNNANNMKVLFVITPEASPTANPPPGNGTK
jgi:hypothetical protein